MRSLDILQRLAKQAVERERQALQAIGAEIAAVESTIEDKQRAIDAESSASLDFMTSGVTLSAFIRVNKQRMHDLRGAAAPAAGSL